MKKSIIILLLSIATGAVNAQIAIGKQTVNGNSTLLDFNDAADNMKGIILPSVQNTNTALASTPAHNNGTFLFDRSESVVKMFENGTWKTLGETGSSAQITVNTSDDSSESQGAIIGSDTSSAKGVLVLESSNKAMILPKILNPHLTVKSPYPGMMCYDTVSRTVAIFDGLVWNYYK